MIELKLYVLFGSSESTYKIVSADVRLITSTKLLSFNKSTLAGNVRLLVLSLIQASVQLTSSRVIFIRGCSSGGMGLSFLQDIKISGKNNNIEANKAIFIISPKLIIYLAG